ncbi:hypothetical protein H5410_025068 [Solanum commersonii]|uniref:Defensin-like protein n=1 Tax=Solanum commersonii TaxID=4109 RepID=A0A9J5YUW1_SOLCO|nr:hypothetical protein H5410_025068 [Solanum commersonii]
MSLISQTLLIFLFLIFGSGSIVVASKNATPCLTYLGICGGSCDKKCCDDKCINSFQGKNPYSICQLIPGNPGRLCNCYHDC